MIERADYLHLCQKCAMLNVGINNIALDVPGDLRVVYNGIEYYPLAYAIYFNADSTPRHIAILHDLQANAVVDANLQDVERKKHVESASESKG